MELANLTSLELTKLLDKEMDNFFLDKLGPYKSGNVVRYEEENKVAPELKALWVERFTGTKWEICFPRVESILDSTGPANNYYKNRERAWLGTFIAQVKTIVDNSIFTHYLGIKQDLAKLGEAVKAYCQDTSIPLNVRWELFYNTEFGSQQCWIHNFTDEGMENWSKFFSNPDYYSRHEVVNLPEAIDNQESDWMNGYAYDWVNKESLNQIKEYVLQNWIRSFQIDW